MGEPVTFVSVFETNFSALLSLLWCVLHVPFSCILREICFRALLAEDLSQWGESDIRGSHKARPYLPVCTYTVSWLQ